MMKKALYICLLAVFISCLLPLAGEKEVSARDNTAGNIQCTSSVETDFPLKLNFKISAESTNKITDIRLHYSTNMESFAPVTSEAFIQFIPNTSVDTQWSWDMRKTGGLPPGTIIEYWWTVTDAGGGRTETVPTSISFDDNRYDWQSLSEGNITIFWYEGNQSFAAELMSTAQQALNRLEQNTGALLKKPADIYIYGDSRDLQSAMVFPQEWTGGVAFTLYNIIAIGIEPYNIAWGKSAIIHELTHLVIEQMVSNPYIDLPTWLNEGLAMYTEETLSSSLTSTLEKAIDGNRLISVRSLSSPFSTDTETAYLSYAQSYSLIEFLITVYGQDKMLELLTIFSEGSGYDEALEKVYSFNMDGLDTLWRDYVTMQYRIAEAKTTAPLPVSAASLTGHNGRPDLYLPFFIHSRSLRWN
ncbi:peptidase MA family metallohydrolase [Chloroflexota bacterium]